MRWFSLDKSNSLEKSTAMSDVTHGSGGGVDSPIKQSWGGLQQCPIYILLLSGFLLIYFRERNEETVLFTYIPSRLSKLDLRAIIIKPLNFAFHYPFKFIRWS